MDIRQLRYYIAVVEEGNISSAARSLHVSQPPLSSSMQSLEEELGVRLFDRGPRKIVLTDAGKALYGRAQVLVNMFDSVREEISSLGEGSRGTLRIGMVSSLSRDMVSGWLRAFSKRFPQIAIEITESNTYSLVEMLHARTLDMAVIRTPFNDEGLEVREIKSEELCIALDHMSSLSPNEILSSYPLIVYRRWENILQNFFKAKGIRSRIVLKCDTAGTALSMARKAIGAAIVPMSALDGPETDGLFLILLNDESLSSKISLVTLRSRKLSEPERWFADGSSSISK